MFGLLYEGVLNMKRDQLREANRKRKKANRKLKEANSKVNNRVSCGVN